LPAGGDVVEIEIKRAGKQGEVALDQIQTINKFRLLKSMGNLDELYHSQLLTILAPIFSE
jgi:mRNA-degrading endonuclease toxin of MazEF toxin-antitoxin module